MRTPTMRRRVLACLAAAPLVARAQTAQRTYRIGFLTAVSAEGSFFPVMRDELRRLGYEDGRNTEFVIREVKGQPEKTAGFAAELVASKVDVIVADLPRSILAVQRATSTIPIVMLFGMVPQELGLIQSMARPGGNVTGTLIQGPEAAGKGTQVVREILPPRARIAIMFEAEYPGLGFYIDQYESATLAAGFRPTRFPIRGDDDIEPALVRIAAAGTEALSISPTGPVFRKLERIFDFAPKQRIAILSSTKWLVEHGALLAFEPDLRLLRLRACAIVDKILKGAKPAEIPVEAPTRYELWLNMKVANALGLKVPSLVRLQADRVFE